jgi:hypothetical protein
VRGQKMELYVSDRKLQKEEKEEGKNYKGRRKGE